MSLPGFTAETSVYASHDHYVSGAAFGSGGDVVVPQQSCGWRRAARCMARVGRCVVQCGVTPQCYVSCLGSRLRRCAPCIARVSRPAWRAVQAVL